MNVWLEGFIFNCRCFLIFLMFKFPPPWSFLLDSFHLFVFVHLAWYIYACACPFVHLYCTVVVVHWICTYLSTYPFMESGGECRQQREHINYKSLDSSLFFSRSWIVNFTEKGNESWMQSSIHHKWLYFCHQRQRPLWRYGETMHRLKHLHQRAQTLKVSVRTPAR